MAHHHGRHIAVSKPESMEFALVLVASWLVILLTCFLHSSHSAELPVLKEANSEHAIVDIDDDYTPNMRLDRDKDGKVVFACLEEWNASTTRVLNSLSELRELQTDYDEGDFVTEAVAAWRPGIHLQSISIDEKTLTDEIILQWGKLQNLKYLSLGDNQLSGKCFAHLAKCRSLITLDCNYNPLESKYISELSNLKKLRELDLSGTDIKDEHCKYIFQIDGLKSLGLNETLITNKFLSDIGEYPSLKWLYIRDSLATKAGVEEFERINPECVVFWR